MNTQRVRRSRSTLRVVTLVALCSACTVDVGPAIAGICDGSDSDGSREVSFRRDVLRLFQRAENEAGCPCHFPSDPTAIGFELGGLDLSNYGGVRAGGNNSGATLVMPGNPCESILVQKVGDAPPFGSRMPLSGPPYLTPEEQQVIVDWIAEGARDN